MPLFQKSVLDHYKSQLDSDKLREAYQRLQSQFLDPDKQAQIRASKEEQYQEGFIRDFFCKVLGYTISPNPDFNIITEVKNQNNSKKADAGIIVEGKVVAVIELKGTKVIDLGKIQAQAFGYLSNQKEAKYVVTSNFEKLRFYFDKATDYEEFNLFTLSYAEFQKLWICLSYESIKTNLPQKVNKESLVKEEDITKQLYKDYSAFKKALFNDIVEQNPEIDKLLLFKKTQKLIDRFLFILFAEDKDGLLPANSISNIINKYKVMIEQDFEKPLYDVFKQYFGYIDTGRPQNGDRQEIFAFNGGLFAPDEILDKIAISDDVLKVHTEILTAYDFNSEVDVNILGHIFEHSLNEIDEMTAELEGRTVEKNKTKRKKDGVFYTPKYITKYIVDNTIGKLAEEKRTELNIVEEDYISAKAKKKRKVLLEKLNTYKDYLLSLTICDPACGSGAFLNQALQKLIEEHNYIAELESKLFGAAMVLTDVSANILENNLYGVDINEESVQIAQLSLWLRTARKGRKLNTLSNNLKCGNSLIDDPEVAGDKAFKWKEEFPEVFAKGGFDVVIGNPPYVRVQTLKEHYYEETLWMESKYQSATNKYDLYALFTELAYELVNSQGSAYYIMPHKFLVADFGVGLRQFLTSTTFADSILHFGSTLVFKEASTYTCILGLSKGNKETVKFKYIHPEKILDKISFDNLNYKFLDSGKWKLLSDVGYSVINKIHSYPALKTISKGIYQGIITTGDDIFMLEGRIEGNVFNGYSKALNEDVEIESGLLKKVLKGQDIKRYLPLNSERYLIYPHRLDNNNKTKPIEEDNLRTEFPKTYNYLENFKESLTEKKVRYKTNPKYWYSLHRSRDIELFENDFIITPQLQNHPSFTVKETDVYPDAGGYLIKPNEDINISNLLAVLNSNLLWFYIKNTSSEYSGGYFYFKTKYLEHFGVPANKGSEFVELVSDQLIRSKGLENQRKKLLKLLLTVSSSFKVTKILSMWFVMTFEDFLNELKKQKIKFSLSDQAEWMEYFETEKAKALSIQSDIDKTDREIDAMVYELYGLTEEEIAIVEGVTK